MFFDAVLDKDAMPIISGTPEEVKEWLRDEYHRSYAEEHGAQVCLGQTLKMTSIEKYLNS